MKFCPYCGASLVGGAVSFCAECGRELPEKSPVTGEERPARSHKARRRNAVKSSRKPPAPPKPNPMDEHYDGYYDDVPPIDAGEVGERMDPALAKQIALLILGAVGVIGLSVALMMLL